MEYSTLSQLSIFIGSYLTVSISLLGRPGQVLAVHQGSWGFAAYLLSCSIIMGHLFTLSKTSFHHLSKGTKILPHSWHGCLNYDIISAWHAARTKQTIRCTNWESIRKLNNKTFTYKIQKEFIQFKSRERSRSVIIEHLTNGYEKAKNYKYCEEIKKKRERNGTLVCWWWTKEKAQPSLKMDKGLSD